MMLMSRREAIEQTVIKNLLSAHRRIADQGSAAEVIRITKYVLRLAEKRPDKLQYFVTENEQGGGCEPVQELEELHHDAVSLDSKVFQDCTREKEHAVYLEQR